MEIIQYKLIEYVKMLQSEGLLRGIAYGDAFYKDDVIAVDDPGFNGVPCATLGTALDTVVADVSYNSREVLEGGIFICKGANFKADFLRDAISKGIVAFVCDENGSKDEEIAKFAQGTEAAYSNGTEAAYSNGTEAAEPKCTPMLVVSDIRKAISRLSAMFLNHSWADLKIIGITGTKGKSTTACMIKAILDKYQGREIGFSSGIYTYDGANHVKSKKLTTPETIELHKILDKAYENGCNYLAMEVSSQGLKYDRVLDLDYEIGCFLNISKDHISAAEHSDMDDYLNSKLKLFEKAKIGLVNADMDPNYVSRVLDAANEGCKEVVLLHEPKVKEGPGYIDIETKLDGKEESFRVNIGGSYNGINAVFAINVCHILGVPLDVIREALKEVIVPGRMEHYVLKEGVDVIVDCAHNKMSYEGLFNYADLQYPGKTKYFLFGCVGDKAYNRRKEAAEIVDRFADHAVITERDPGKEPVENICNEIYENIVNKEKAEIITNRDEAVRTILDRAANEGNSVVLLCGCGSDAYVKRGTALIEFPTDGERVREYIDGIEI